MSDRLLVARQVADAWNSPGGRIIQAEIEECIKRYTETIDGIMESPTPERLFAKNAIAIASKRKALLDLKEFVKDAMQPLEAM